MTTLRILHLFARELGINGDRGNVLALDRRLTWRGLRADVIEAGIGDRVPAEPHLVHIGSGPRSALETVLASGDHASALRDWAAAAVPIIGIGAGFHLLSERIVSAGGAERPGAAVLPVLIRDAPGRVVGEVLGTATPAGRLAGFVNHGVEVDRRGVDPFAVLERGRGDGPRDEEPALDGARSGSVIGTHLGGPVLPMNPAVADELLRAALARLDAALPEADERTLLADDRARRARAAIAGRLGRAGIDV